MAIRSSEPATARLPWPPDDTEESVVGSGLHQQAIATLYNTLQALAQRENEQWGIGNQATLLELVRRDGTLYAPMPDIFVHPRPFALGRSSLSVVQEGPPHLIIEVASPSTVANDVGEKAFAYSRAGIKEYIVFDPSGDELGTQMWAQRAGSAGFVTWQPESNGRWFSTTLGIAFAPQGVLLRVYDRQGNLLPTFTEQSQWLRAQEQRLRDQEQQLHSQEQQLHSQEQQLHSQEQQLHNQEQQLHNQDQRIAALEAELRRSRDEQG